MYEYIMDVIAELMYSATQAQDLHTKRSSSIILQSSFIGEWVVCGLGSLSWIPDPRFLAHISDKYISKYSWAVYGVRLSGFGLSLMSCHIWFAHQNGAVEILRQISLEFGDERSCQHSYPVHPRTRHTSQEYFEHIWKCLHSCGQCDSRGRLSHKLTSQGITDKY